MYREQEEFKTIYIGYHPRTHDGSTPQLCTLSDAIVAMDAFNKQEREERVQAEVVKIACSDLCAVAIMDTTIDKVWQYI